MCLRHTKTKSWKEVTTLANDTGVAGPNPNGVMLVAVRAV